MSYKLHMNNGDVLFCGDRVDVYYYGGTSFQTDNQIGIRQGLKCLGCNMQLIDAMEHPDSYIVNSDMLIPIKNISYIKKES